MDHLHFSGDEILIAQIVVGDSLAFETIYKKYARDLFSFVRKATRNKEDAQEIIQDVFESLWNRREHLGHVTSLKGYLINAVKYKLIRYFSHKKVIQKYADHFLAFETLYDSIPDIDQEQSLKSLLLEGITELPERCQQAFTLRLSENLSHAEIAQRMGITKASVKRYMTMALTFFKEKHSPAYKSKQRFLSPE
jgi:RNA polymerase sigma-70 factor, ECF subfamily